MSRNEKTRRAVLILSALSLAVSGAMAGCTKTDDPEVATANPNAAASKAAAGSSGGGDAAVGKCMREEYGYEFFPDSDPSGGFPEFDFPKTVDRMKFDKDMDACSQKYLPRSSPEDDAADEAKAREFAKCMRANGVPNYPDPTPKSTSKDQRKEGSGDKSTDLNNPTVKKAAQGCAKYLPGGKLETPDDEKDGA